MPPAEGIKKFIAVLLTGVFFTGQCVFAGPLTGRNVLPSRRSLPGPAIFHIQDVHANSEAQADIARIIRDRIQNYNVDFIAVEGAFAPVDLAPFQSFPSQSSIRTVADFLLEQNQISGPLHAALTGGNSFPPIIGIDQKNLYEANVDAVRQSVRLKARALNAHRERLKEIQNGKKIVFNPQLAAWDKVVQSYYAGDRPLGDYALELSRRVSRLYPQLELFASAYDVERRLDLDRVREERRRVLSRLASALSRTELETLLQSSNGKEKEFYALFLRLAEKTGLDLRNTPAFDDYVRYVRLRDQIQTDGLFADIRKAETDVYSALIQTDGERALVAASRRNHLEGKLIEFSLTREEWEEYKRTKSDERNSQQTRRSKFAFGDSKLFRTSNIGLRSFEQFYQEAEARDQAMAENLLAAMKKYDAKNVVLVTGGFHAEGVKSNLESRNSEFGTEFSMINYVPRISKIEGPRKRGSDVSPEDMAKGESSSYLSVFLQEKTPLERLFSGEKLLLSPLFYPPVKQKIGATLALAQGALDGLNFSRMQLMARAASTRNSVVRNVTIKEKTVVIDENPYEVAVAYAGGKIESAPRLVTPAKIELEKRPSRFEKVVRYSAAGLLAGAALIPILESGPSFVRVGLVLGYIVVGVVSVGAPPRPSSKKLTVKSDSLRGLSKNKVAVKTGTLNEFKKLFAMKGTRIFMDIVKLDSYRVAKAIQEILNGVPAESRMMFRRANAVLYAEAVGYLYEMMERYNAGLLNPAYEYDLWNAILNLVDVDRHAFTNPFILDKIFQSGDRQLRYFRHYARQTYNIFPRFIGGRKPDGVQNDDRMIRLQSAYSVAVSKNLLNGKPVYAPLFAFPLMILLFPALRSHWMFMALSAGFVWAVYKAVQTFHRPAGEELEAARLAKTVRRIVAGEGLKLNRRQMTRLLELAMPDPNAGLNRLDGSVEPKPFFSQPAQQFKKAFWKAMNVPPSGRLSVLAHIVAAQTPAPRDLLRRELQTTRLIGLQS